MYKESKQQLPQPSRTEITPCCTQMLGDLVTWVTALFAFFCSALPLSVATSCNCIKFGVNAMREAAFTGAQEFQPLQYRDRIEDIKG
jgi:hypothetical protein